MAQKETYFFSHDYNARNDDKILQVRAKHGPSGYGIYWMIIETMAESSTGLINSSLMDGLCLSYGSSMGDLMAIFETCVSVGLFRHENGNYFSPRMLSHKKNIKEFKEERSATGLLGAQARWGSKKKSKEIKNSSPIADPKLTDGSAIAIYGKVK